MVIMQILRLPLYIAVQRNKITGNIYETSWLEFTHDNDDLHLRFITLAFGRL